MDVSGCANALTRFPSEREQAPVAPRSHMQVDVSPLGAQEFPDRPRLTCISIGKRSNRLTGTLPLCCGTPTAPYSRGKLSLKMTSIFQQAGDVHRMRGK